MIQLQVGRALNINGKFKIGSWNYGVIGEHETGELVCFKYRENDGVVQKTVLDSVDVPDYFERYRFRITNPEVFEPGKVIFVYKKYEDRINKMYAIIRNCTTEMISFTFRDNGGELKTQGLTARQIAAHQIVVMLFPEPKIF